MGFVTSAASVGLQWAGAHPALALLAALVVAVVGYSAVSSVLQPRNAPPVWSPRWPVIGGALAFLSFPKAAVEAAYAALGGVFTLNFIAKKSQS